MWPPDGRSEQYGDLASVSWWILEEAAGVLPHTGTRPGGGGRRGGGGDEEYLFALSGTRHQWGELVRVPVLQEVLGILDLVLCPCDGDDAVLRAL